MDLLLIAMAEAARTGAAIFKGAATWAHHHHHPSTTGAVCYYRDRLQNTPVTLLVVILPFPQLPLEDGLERGIFLHSCLDELTGQELGTTTPT